MQGRSTKESGEDRKILTGADFLAVLLYQGLPPDNLQPLHADPPEQRVLDNRDFIKVAFNIKYHGEFIMSSFGYLMLFCTAWIAYSCYLVLKNVRWAGNPNNYPSSQPIDPDALTGWRVG
ncbi:MAG: hypothetical protein HQL78_10925 [Magnetococcales bacterium]|nr:hypothetical protein [Magnetococcales bacterium]MBF0420663.1 hypothetical protein [Magnetococcales bacterium]